MEIHQVPAFLQDRGYRYFGGISNEVYLSETRGEVLKLAVSAETAELDERRAAFDLCHEISRLYVAPGLMPEVYETGSNFAGTGYPYLRERYVPGQNLTRAYLENPSLGTEVLPGELLRIYQAVIAGGAHDVRASWEEKIDGIPRPPATDEIYQRVRAAGERLTHSSPVGYRIHGDLQFGNILAVPPPTAPPAIMLIDWEVSEIMPLGYEFAMLYTFLLDPIAQVGHDLQPEYRRIAPLRPVWGAIAPVLEGNLGVGRNEFEDSVIFRMGTGWLFHLERAIHAGNRNAAEKRYRDLVALTTGQYFSLMPYLHE